MTAQAQNDALHVPGREHHLGASLSRCQRTLDVIVGQVTYPARDQPLTQIAVVLDVAGASTND